MLMIVDEVNVMKLNTDNAVLLIKSFNSMKS